MAFVDFHTIADANIAMRKYQDHKFTQHPMEKGNKQLFFYSFVSKPKILFDTTYV
jgi:hypothetical protein